MKTSVLLNYEEVRERLNLHIENENEDRITVLFCNNIINSVLNLTGKNIESLDKEIITQLVCKIFLKVREMDELKSGDSGNVNLTDAQMMNLFDAVQETVEVM